VARGSHRHPILKKIYLFFTLESLDVLGYGRNRNQNLMNVERIVAENREKCESVRDGGFCSCCFSVVVCRSDL